MTHELASQTKAWTSLRGREVAALGRELLGGNGIVSDFLVRFLGLHEAPAARRTGCWALHVRQCMASEGPPSWSQQRPAVVITCPALLCLHFCCTLAGDTNRFYACTPPLCICGGWSVCYRLSERFVRLCR